MRGCSRHPAQGRWKSPPAFWVGSLPCAPEALVPICPDPCIRWAVSQAFRRNWTPVPLTENFTSFISLTSPIIPSGNPFASDSKIQPLLPDPWPPACLSHHHLLPRVTESAAPSLVSLLLPSPRQFVLHMAATGFLSKCMLNEQMRHGPCAQGFHSRKKTGNHCSSQRPVYV